MMFTSLAACLRAHTTSRVACGQNTVAFPALPAFIYLFFLFFLYLQGEQRVAKTQQPSPPHLYFFEFFLFTRRAAFGVC
jgi:hypothetical protein